jgi:pimeloyl-ACP methyl ester carboxylesterase
MLERQFVARYGGEVRASRLGATGMLLRSVVVSSEYTPRDRVNYARGIVDSMRLLWPQLLELNLFEQVPDLCMPVFFMEGRHDWEVPSAVAAAYFDALRAPAKELVWFDRSAHLPHIEERDRFNQIMRDEVRAALVP